MCGLFFIAVINYAVTLVDGADDGNVVGNVLKAGSGIVKAIQNPFDLLSGGSKKDNDKKGSFFS